MSGGWRDRFYIAYNGNPEGMDTNDDHMRGFAIQPVELHCIWTRMRLAGETASRRNASFYKLLLIISQKLNPHKYV